MIYITQLIYLQKGQEAIFDQFEAVAIPLIAKYNGRLSLRLRPGDSAFIETDIETDMERPYEIHLAEFLSESDFDLFMKDEERQKFLHLKEQSIKSVVLIKGSRL